MEGTSRRYGVFATRIKSDIAYWSTSAGGVKTQEKYRQRPGLFCGLILLFSTENGEPPAIMNDGYLQHLRVGATAGIAAKYLSSADADTVGMIGSGGMAWTHALAFAEVRRLKRIQVYSPTPANRDAFAGKLAERLGIEAIPVATAEAAVKGAQIVSACTDATVPVIPGRAVDAGAFICTVKGSVELDRSCAERVRTFYTFAPNTDAAGEAFGAAVSRAQKISGTHRAYVAGQPGRIWREYRRSNGKAVSTSAKSSASRILFAGANPGRRDGEEILGVGGNQIPGYPVRFGRRRDVSSNQRPRAGSGISHRLAAAGHSQLTTRSDDCENFGFSIFDFGLSDKIPHLAFATTGSCLPNPKSKIQNQKLTLLAAVVVLHQSARRRAPKWQTEWDRTVRAAEQEGQVNVSIGGYGALIETGVFQKAYPKIKVNYITGAGTDITQRIVAERRAGKYLLDVYNGGGVSLYQALYLGKMLEPIKPALILPEVLDTSKWWEGKHKYSDKEGEYVFVYEGNVSAGAGAAFNTQLIDAREYKSYWDLFNPKLKGKILSSDIRRVRGAGIPWQFLYYSPELGPKFLRRFFSEMDVTMSADLRQSVDWLGAGKFSLILPIQGGQIHRAKNQGLPVEEFEPHQFQGRCELVIGVRLPGADEPRASS